MSLGAKISIKVQSAGLLFLLVQSLPGMKFPLGLFSYLVVKESFVFFFNFILLEC